MKVVLGILLLANAALLLWSLGQREFLQGKYSPAKEFHPELMELIPAGNAENTSTMAKVTLEANGETVTSNGGQKAGSDNSSDQSAGTVENAEMNIARQAAATSQTEKIQAKPGQCLLIGPYKTALNRGRAGRQLQDMKLVSSEYDDPQGRVLGYRVYQGPFNSQSDVSRAKRRLEKQGVKDLYLINEGPGSRFISLGFFSNEKSANVFMRNYAEFKVKSKLRLEYATNYWVKVSDLEAINKLNEKSAIPLPAGISKTIRPCDETR